MERCRNEDGYSEILGAAALIPVFFLLLAALIQIHLVVNAKQTVQAAAYAGARAGVNSVTPATTAKEVVRRYAGGTLPGWDYGEDLRFSYAYDGAKPDRYLTVRVRYIVPLLVTGFAPEPFSEMGVLWASGESRLRLEENP